jgi:deaminated glutathione amidase
MGTFGIAGLQLSLDEGDNLDYIESEIAAACARLPWVQMVVLGELAVFGPSLARAQPLPGPAERRLQAMARRHKVWLLPGSIYERRDDRIFNTAPVIGPDGTVVTRCRKLFPFLPYERGVDPGAEFCVFDVPEVGRFGVSICYDMWFPETTRSLCWLGAELILHPTMTNTVDRDAELAIVRASAATNQCYFFDVCVAGRLGNGRSIACGPGGEVLYQAGSDRDVWALEIDPDNVRRTRATGWHRLGQTLKSFRDSTVVFPAYGAAAAPSAALARYGALSYPRTRGEP